MNNVFISYDLHSPGQDYGTLYEGIKSLGEWAHVQDSVWYVSTEYSATRVISYLAGFIDSNDSLIAIDASNNESQWRNLTDEVASHIQRCWKI